MPASTAIQPERSPTASNRRPAFKLALVFMVAALVCGFFEAWLARNDMYTDGISYLDLGDAFLHGDWKAAVNLYWSPLYPLLLGGAMGLLKPNAIWEFPVVHLVNCVVFALTVLAFQYFLAGFLRRRSDSLPDSIWIALAYTVFLWSTLRLIGVGLVSPDMCVAGCVFLAVGILQRIAFDPALWRYTLLGVSLGVGYLAKAPVLPVGLVLGAISLSCVQGFRSRALRAAIAALAFVIVAGPWIYALTWVKGCVSFGESWSLNVSWYVDDVPRYHWHGEAALHPTRQIFEKPPVYAFNGPVSGTYPIWYDPAYWHAGIQPRFASLNVLRQIRANGFDYYQLFFHLQIAVAVICLAWFLMCGRGHMNWMLILPSLAALLMYVPVHVEDRMIGAYVVLLWLGMFSSAAVIRPEQREFAYSTALALVIVQLAQLGLSVAGTAGSRAHAGGNPQAEIAQQLRSKGLRAGEKVAWIRPQVFTPVENYGWARLAKLRIVGEIPGPSETAFWRSNAEAQQQIFGSLRESGAKALVTTNIPAGASAAGWIPLGKSGYSIRFLND
ncbi:MAG TPA: hypothetical protein VKX49_17960 [Bryobacteraceae bacterium]|nr:hypothetical protein [Bryobacteraceae bacterium]